MSALKKKIKQNYISIVCIKQNYISITKMLNVENSALKSPGSVDVD